jgi:hypothetical protein
MRINTIDSIPVRPGYRISGSIPDIYREEMGKECSPGNVF